MSDNKVEATGYDRGFLASDIARILTAAATLSDAAHHRLMTMSSTVHLCPVEDCVLSAEEHHRIAYGLIADNRELRRRVDTLEHSKGARS